MSLCCPSVYRNNLSLYLVKSEKSIRYTTSEKVRGAALSPKRTFTDIPHAAFHVGLPITSSQLSVPYVSVAVGIYSLHSSIPVVGFWGISAIVVLLLR